MKYYAVTDDPRELFHYGVKGMKWGEHLFGEDLLPKSQSFKNAAKKLAQNKASRVQKAAKVSTTKGTSIRAVKSNGDAMQRAISKLSKQQNKYDNALKKSQQRIKSVEKLYKSEKAMDDTNTKKFTASVNKPKAIQKKTGKPSNYSKAVKDVNKRNAILEKWSQADEAKRYDKSIDLQYKNQLKAEEREAKLNRKYEKNEPKMEKYTQLAREGRLKYGKLSEEQIGRIQDRLAFENQARNVGGREKPKFRLRAKEALQEGMLQGITQGTAAGMKEIAVAKVQNRLGNKMALNRQNRNEAHREHDATRIRNKRSHREMRQDFKAQVYEQSLKNGQGMIKRNLNLIRTSDAARNLQNMENANHERERARAIEDRIRDRLADDYGDVRSNEQIRTDIIHQTRNQIRERENARIEEARNNLNRIKEEQGSNSNEYKEALKEFNKMRRGLRGRINEETNIELNRNRREMATDNQRLQYALQQHEGREREANRQAYEHNMQIEDANDSEHQELLRNWNREQQHIEEENARRLDAWNRETEQIDTQRANLERESRELALQRVNNRINSDDYNRELTELNNRATSLNNRIRAHSTGPDLLINQYGAQRPERQHLSYDEWRRYRSMSGNNNQNNRNKNKNKNSNRNH